MQLTLPMHPAGSTAISALVSVLRQDGQVAYFASGVPLFVHADNDATGERIAAIQMIELRLARQSEVSEALGVDRSTLFRQQRKLKSEGVLGVVDKKRGPQGRHRFTEAKRRRVEQSLAGGSSIREAARMVELSEGIVRHALKRGELQYESGGADHGKSMKGPQERSARAVQAKGGVAVERHGERALARMGQLTEAAPKFESVESVRYGGALLVLPALLAEGLLDAGEKVYGTLRNGFYGLRATLLILAFMVMLRIRTPEALQGHPPGELGILLGLDRAPEVKTLRRKIWELAGRRQSTQMSRLLAERWVKEGADQIGLLYVDGHVRAYHGTAHRLPKGYVTRRRMSMPATTDFWVNQQDAQPILVVTTPANDDMITVLRQSILPEVRSLVGTREVTLVFDREGYSPKFFRELNEQHFAVITYRKGNYPEWPMDEFREVTESIDGRQITYTLAERNVEMLEGFSMREVRRLCESGHQTAILTTRRDLSMVRVAYRMFERWTQENFFRYMRQHFALDALVTYATEPADSERLILNPRRKELRKTQARIRAELQDLTRRYGERAFARAEGQRASRRRAKSDILVAEMPARIRKLQAESETIKAQIKSLPERVPIKLVLPEAEIVRLEPETKHLTDTIKMVAYRAETALVGSLSAHFARSEDEGRALIREILLSNADLLVESTERRLVVRPHSLSNPRSNAALAKLCETLTALGVVYPGTDLTLVYEPPSVA